MLKIFVYLNLWFMLLGVAAGINLCNIDTGELVFWVCNHDRFNQACSTTETIWAKSQEILSTGFTTRSA